MAIITRVCRKCEQTKSISDFYRNAHGVAGFDSLCKKCKIKVNTEYRIAHPDSHKGAYARAKARDPQKVLDRHAVLRLRERRTVLEYYGGNPPNCACCGERREAFLVIDHTNNDGAEHRRQLGGYRTKIYKWLIKEDFPDGFRVLCANCNTTLGLRGFCPHDEETIFFSLLHPEARIPERAYDDDAGHDLFVCEPVRINPSEFADVRAGIAVALPFGYYAEIVGRSSTLRHRGLLVNPAVIDGGYRGELYAGVWNLSSESVDISVGERLAQVILHEIIVPAWASVEVDELPQSDRGKRGFGSSGR